MSFSTAISGLNAAQNLLSVTGNNVANANTTGFKRSRSEFADIYNNSIGRVGDTTPGSGVKVARVAQLFDQGNLEYTENSLDLAMNGDGFFITGDSVDDTATRYFTRAGNFSVNKDGYLVNNLDQPLLTYEPKVEGSAEGGFNTGEFVPVKLQAMQSDPRATTSVALTFNLNSKDLGVPGTPAADGTPAVFDPKKSTTYNWASSATVYDSLGTAHTVTSYFIRNSAAKAAVVDGAGAVTTPATTEQWSIRTYLDGSEVTTVPAEIKPVFDTLGKLYSLDGTTPPTAPTTPLTFEVGPVTVDKADPLKFTYDLRNSTLQAADYNTNALTQDGAPIGNMTGIRVDTSGVIFANYSNGDSKALAKLAVARFQNQQGLTKVGNTEWTQSMQSGQAIYGEASNGSFGSITSGALENSNVDIAAQLINMIIAQQTYQANAQSITTENTITQAILNIR
jgi:flagellar hook protein FlgE